MPGLVVDRRGAGERITATVQVRAGVDELLARLVGSALERELARLAGASSPTAGLVSSQQLSRGGAATVVAAARAVNDTVEATRTAWSQGRVNTDQAVLIASTVTTWVSESTWSLGPTSRAT